LPLPPPGSPARTLHYPGVQPGRFPRHAPARLIRGQARRILDLLANLRVGSLQTSGGAQHDLHAGAACQGDPQQRLEDPSHLDVRQAISLVQRNHSGLGIGAKLTGGCPQGVGGLQRVAALEPTAAAGATAEVDVELADMGPTWDFRLILLADLRFLDGSAAVRASSGQGSLQNLIDLLGRGTQAVAIATVGGTPLPAWRLGPG